MQVGCVQRKLNKRWYAAHFVSGSGPQRRRSRRDINPFYVARTELTGLYTCPDSVWHLRGSASRLLFPVFWTLFTGTCVIDAGDVACSPGRTRANSIKGGLRSRHFNDTAVEVLSCGSFSGRRASLLRAPKTPFGWHPFGSAPRVTITRRALNVKSGLVCGGHGVYDKITWHLCQHLIPL